MAKILLVEDDNNLREIYEARLQAEGYDIVSAKDGEEALVVAKAEHPDLIISDVMMPKISGFEMLDILRNTPGLKDTKIIMLTALGQAEDQTRANQLGADRYLVKSQVTLEDIVQESHNLLNISPQVQPPIDSPAITYDAPQPVSQPPVEPPQPMPTATPEPMSTPNYTAGTDPFAPQPVSQPPVEPPQPMPTSSTPSQPAESFNISIDANGQLAQTEAEENAVMNQQVSDFITSTPNNTTSDSLNSTNQMANDQTLAQAVNSMMSGVQTSPVMTTVSDTQTGSNNTNTTPSTNSNNDTSLPVSISGKKIISPIEQQPSKSLDQLAAQEEAMEVIENKQAAMHSNNENLPPLNPMDGSDPNNIAL